MKEIQKENLTSVNIKDFDETFTIYITESNYFNKPLRLCQFISYEEKTNMVKGQIIDVDESYQKGKIGEIISCKLDRCALYGVDVAKNYSHYHWFTSDGYALNPNDKDKVAESKTHLNSHPSFGLVRFTRSMGSARSLYGSSINHSNTITLTISSSEHERGLSGDSFRSKKRLINIELSQTQFAELITTMNVGEGVPCTIRDFNGSEIEYPPYKSRVEIFNEEFSNFMHNLGVDIKKSSEIAIQMLRDKPNLTKGDRDLILKSIEGILANVENNVPYIGEKFSEQMSKTITEAKGEIEAFIESKVRAVGLESIKESGFPSLKELGEGVDVGQKGG